MLQQTIEGNVEAFISVYLYGLSCLALLFLPFYSLFQSVEIDLYDSHGQLKLFKL